MMYRVKKDGLAFFVSNKEKAEYYEANGYEVEMIDVTPSSNDGGVAVSVTGVGRGTRQ